MTDEVSTDVISSVLCHCHDDVLFTILCDTKFNLNDSPHFSFKAESLSDCCSDTLIINLIYIST
jgi:hypothetical protein